MTLPTTKDGGIDVEKMYILDGAVFIYDKVNPLSLSEYTKTVAAHERERCASLALAHKGSARKAREKKGHSWSEEIGAEERGEDIASEMIAAAIRNMKD